MLQDVRSSAQALILLLPLLVGSVKSEKSTATCNVVEVHCNFLVFSPGYQSVQGHLYSCRVIIIA